MTSVAGMVMVMPSGHAAADIERNKTSVFGTAAGHADTAWDACGIADGWIELRPAPVGFDLLILRFSATALVRDPEKVRRCCNELAVVGRALGARFAFVTRYDAHLEYEWIEREVLIPMLFGDDGDVSGHPFESIPIPLMERGAH